MSAIPSHTSQLTSRPTPRGLFALLAATLATALTAGACGESSPSREEIRDEVTSAACSYYARCNEIGAGNMYASADECNVKQRAIWEDMWPTEECDGKISSSAADACLLEINVAMCGNALDFLSALDKCSRGRICSDTGK